MPKVKIRTAARRNTDRRPGSTNEALRRRMSDLLADEFSKVGEQLYDEAVAAINEDVERIFREGVSRLGGQIKKKLGELGYDESVKHFRPWLEGIVSDLRTSGMQEVIRSLDGIASEFSVQYSEGGDDLLEVDAPEGEEPPEAVPATPEAEEVPEVSEEDVEALLAGEGLPGAPEEEEKPAAAAKTVGDFKRRFRREQKSRRVVADPSPKDALLQEAQKSLKLLGLK